MCVSRASDRGSRGLCQDHEMWNRPNTTPWNPPSILKTTPRTTLNVTCQSNLKYIWCCILLEIPVWILLSPRIIFPLTISSPTVTSEDWYLESFFPSRDSLFTLSQVLYFSFVPPLSFLVLLVLLHYWWSSYCLAPVVSCRSDEMLQQLPNQQTI